MMNSHNKLPIVTGAGSGHEAPDLTHKADSRIVRVRKRQFYHSLITSPHPYNMKKKDEHAVHERVTEGNQ